MALQYDRLSFSILAGIMLPVTKIANRLRPHGVLVLVDGAHGPGQVDQLNLAEMGVDFYVASMNKVCTRTFIKSIQKDCLLLPLQYFLFYLLGAGCENSQKLVPVVLKNVPSELCL